MIAFPTEKHSVRVRLNPNRTRNAVCDTCGWQGLSRRTTATADADGRRHVADAASTPTDEADSDATDAVIAAAVRHDARLVAAGAAAAAGVLRLDGRLYLVSVERSALDQAAPTATP